MLDTITGLPAHPLLAHLVAVLVPVTALLAVLGVVWPAARRRIGGASLFVAVATLAAVPLTTAAGGWLHSRVMGSQMLDQHAALGSRLVLWSALLTVAMICWWALHTPLFAAEVGALAPAIRRVGVVVTAAATLVFAVASTWLVVRIGHSGAQSMWGPMACGG
ncbi:hypothetical protein BST28_04955 [Mycolicibacter kumamotonensis]|jgi:hypothetical protein|uniref:Uncharacterized protein n=1 Tax=Mycolicibacter kumamotonensis TaxID=354243 RepID=A0A1X0EAT6_9MYCO|nr:hypothetical protein [Mycolicibacter kumamotonensis]ORA81834.1 hypothetical protein BST28_04955 [Mycolicibacter kumamotonensis]